MDKNIQYRHQRNGITKWFLCLNLLVLAVVVDKGIPFPLIYLFIIAAQILNILKIKNAELKGIAIKDCKVKISQLTDDTTLIVNSSYESMVAALNTLELFGSKSGLKINTDKTKVTWTGKKDILKIN